jgi:hypothetical protein
MNHNNDAVTKIFYELKGKGCIVAGRKIIESKNFLLFRQLNGKYITIKK